MNSRTALITGSTSGIGLAMANVFAQKGYHIVFNGLEADGAAIAASVAEKHGIRHIFSPANMLQPQALRDMVKLAEETFGGVDVLINNAGIQHVAAIEDFPEDKWDAIISINLSAAFHLTKAVWQGMKTRKFGRIINIASAHGLYASEFKSAYVSAKHGIVGFTKTAALEGAPYNIAVNAICPGYVRTPLVEKQIVDRAREFGISEDEAISKVILAKQAVKDFVSVDTIAELALFLASENSGTLTGTALPVDGGWSAQ